ncbi:recombinase family protein [Vibrio parahaemolyticus]|uniref:Recombinase family protein n=2 Tax=Vibrio parahaemolyticus TaxID=670 RepID=A0AA47L7T8_VIBPH|nr:recombinase family protein [Vibrio parahaemolyticus]MCR9858862.1 recombinase family protein [Vibrio parahaemolyticus]MCX8776616.1 recombinase family protein [Vibrio parahaemolyticus]MCX8859367.1 recombinase family protein [Vibrio parahaemolyticus]MCX8861634.1 recombinase family protein [Vibrio parahaemolyticus]MCX8866330.1 recombinase family protein [Vibrio parahaemolyticus]
MTQNTQLLDLASQVSAIANANLTAKEGIKQIQKIRKRIIKLGHDHTTRQLEVVLATKNRATFKDMCTLLSSFVQDAEKLQQEQTDFAYARISTSDQSIDSQTTAFESKCPTVQVITEEGISGSIPAMERPAMRELLKSLKKGDTLWVWWFDRLGRDYFDARDTAQALLRRGVTIRTLHGEMTFKYDHSDAEGAAIVNATTDNTINLLAALAHNEKEARLASAAAGREAIKKSDKEKGTNLWAEKYQGRKANTEQHEQIMRLVADGKNNTQIAKALGCSTKTVQRVKKNHSSSN